MDFFKETDKFAIKIFKRTRQKQQTFFFRFSLLICYYKTYSIVLCAIQEAFVG